MKKTSALAVLLSIVIIVGVLRNLNIIAPPVISACMSAEIGFFSRQLSASSEMPAEKAGRLYMARAAAYFVKHDYAHAIADCDKAVGRDPKNTTVYNLRGDAYMASGDFKNAADDFETLAGLEQSIDGKIAAANSLANACVRSGDEQRAIGMFDALLKSYPENAAVIRYRGSAYGKFGDLDRAIDDYSKAVELDPKNAEYYYGRGVFFYRKEAYQKAIDDFNASIKLNPDKASSFYNRGTCYYRLGNDDVAYSDFVRVMELRPYKSIFQMRILYKIAAVGISDITGARMDKWRGRRHDRPGGPGTGQGNQGAQRGFDDIYQP